MSTEEKIAKSLDQIADRLWWTNCFIIYTVIQLFFIMLKLG